MQRPRNVVLQEVPDAFAKQLKEMHEDRDPRLNATLAAARTGGWRTSTLAWILNITDAACSKRIERADPLPVDLVARQALRSASAKANSVGYQAIGAALLLMSENADPAGRLTDALARLDSIDSTGLSSKTLRRLASARHDLTKARDYVPQPRPDVSDIDIPSPVRIQAMMDGSRLDIQRVEKLREMKKVASRVNGAMAADHPDRKVSVEYSAALNDLITKEGFTPYYLAKMLGVTHRAITSRLERHGHREPCPSVVGTPSGVYRGQKIGNSDATKKR